jgi:hypothetical protein
VALRRPGNGWLYVRPDLAERLEPTYTGWQAHERRSLRGGDALRDRRRALPHRHAERAGALRRDAGYDLIEEIGVERIRENSLRQTELLIDLADAPASGSQPARARAPRRHRHRPRRRVPGRAQRARRAADPLRLPPRCRHQDRPHYFTSDAELEHVIARSREIVETARTSAISAPVARH